LTGRRAIAVKIFSPRFFFRFSPRRSVKTKSLDHFDD